MPDLYDGHYINLDRSRDRRAKMERQFAAFGLSDRYRRFPASEGAKLPTNDKSPLLPGERGTFRSHFAVIEEAADTGRPIHVLEDDAILSHYTAPALDLMIGSGILDRTDIIYTETLVPQDLRVLKQFKAMYDAAVTPGAMFDLRKLRIIDLAQLRFACASSYIVNPKSVPRLLERYRAGWERGPALSIDLFMRDEVNSGRWRAACAFPFVTSIDIGEIATSTAGRERSAEMNTDTVLAILRYSFFVGRDLEWLGQRLQQLLAQTVNKRPDPHRMLIEQVVGFILSDHFREF